MQALILIDIQNDFLPGGALAVPDGDCVIPVANALLELPFSLKLATRDFHPEGHGSFASTHNQSPGETVELAGVQQVLWPDHCIQGTVGSQLAAPLKIEKIDQIFHKGTDPLIDSYSAFFDNARKKSTGLEQYLKERNISDLFLAGLATDYCVIFSALDALDLGFSTTIISDGCRGIDLHPGDCERALQNFESKGGKIVSAEEVQQCLMSA